MKIVKAKCSDIPGIIKLNSSNAKCMELSKWITDIHVIKYEYVTNPFAIYYVIKHRNKVIAGLALDFSESNIDIIVVDEKWQGKGLGTQLINKACESVKEEEGPCIKVGSFDKFDAISFYEKLGFKKTDHQLDPFNEKEYWTELTKDLS